jgi:hypothetical protein
VNSSNVKVFFVEYRYGSNRWEALSPFSDLNTANNYMLQQIKQSQGGINGTLNGLTEQDFRIRAETLVKPQLVNS